MATFESAPSSPSRPSVLKDWWKKNMVKSGERRRAEESTEPSCSQQQQHIFGVPLEECVKRASVAISLNQPSGEYVEYGHIPVVVAKCGILLKRNALETEGVFRVSGSARRIKTLQDIFDSPPDYGKKLKWTGYNVHDAANVLRRFLLSLPEPLVPVDFYAELRAPLTNGELDEQEQIAQYRHLIRQLPECNRQLLLYLLDLLAVFSSKADKNLMTAANLAAIFQPAILNHPNHDLAPAEYRLSQNVLIFLIQHQSHFFADETSAPGSRRSSMDRKMLRRKTLAPVPGAISTPLARSNTVPSGNSSSSNNNNRRGRAALDRYPQKDTVLCEDPQVLPPRSSPAAFFVPDPSQDETRLSDSDIRVLNGSVSPSGTSLSPPSSSSTNRLSGWFRKRRSERGSISSGIEL